MIPYICLCHCQIGMALLDSLLGNEAKRFVKRKDSDAGEAGKALEELRGSLYNELRTSEGAKRQQQRFCGPVVAMTFNFMVSVGIILANKLVMGRVGFKFPIFLTLIHYVTAWLLLAIFKTLSILPVSPPARTTPFTSLFSLGAVMAFASGLANTSLKHNRFYLGLLSFIYDVQNCYKLNMLLPTFLTILLINCSVGFYQMAKIAVTPTIVLAEFILFRKTISFLLVQVLALAVVSAGVAVATVTDLEFNLFGAMIAIAWIVPSAVNKILWSNLQQQGNWTALALMWKTTPVTIFFLLALMPWLDPPGVLLFQWDINNSSAILVSAILGFLLQWSGALALGATSATSHVVLGQFKTCVILLGGYFLFKSDPGFVSLCGAVAALCGMSVYTSLNLKKPQDNATKQTLPTLKPKTIDQENVVESEAKDNPTVV
ncbi:hypothetical protein RchiOBHm_Chr5g0076161 [Rosa chinensis]|uniref:Sugar phosphate transporter domain-containing protein n=1 Tax=Rosa chinensis TaxID=74649 RepID=A0A2P6QLN2_ROSCH|nr:hypothetical protein RchiOBHm_Chr5g0076161 [Rosa chinensis]